MATIPTALPQVSPLPLLEAGDHLDQPTFHQRYAAMPASFRAELIAGVVFVPSPHCDLYHTFAYIQLIRIVCYDIEQSLRAIQFTICRARLCHPKPLTICWCSI